MPVVREAPKRRVFPDKILPLENGDHLSAPEFLRRYDAMSDLKKAELIEGKVYMETFSIRAQQHAEPDGITQTWLGLYASQTRGVKHATNPTVRLSPVDLPQPDGVLRLTPECGGQTKIDAKGYLVGVPELVVEVAASSVSVDTREKLNSYLRARVQEYVVWRTRDEAVDWWVLEDDEYIRLEPDADGIIRSRVFPGLWLNVPALVAENAAEVVTTLKQGLASEAHADFRDRLANHSY